MHKILVIRLYFSIRLIQSETCRASNRKINSNHKNFVHLVGLYTYCRMMNGAYNVRKILCCTASLATNVGT